MMVRISIGALALLVLAGLGFWLFTGERGARDASRRTREAPSAPERGAEPLEDVGQAPAERDERESVATRAEPEEEDAEAGSAFDLLEEWPGPCSLHGRLLDPSGERVKGVKVFLKDESGHSLRAEVADGRYRAAGLAPGRWWIETRSAVYAPTRESLEVFRIDGALEYDLTVRPKLIVPVNVLSSTGGSFWEGLSETDLLYGVELSVVATRGLVADPADILQAASRFEPYRRRGRELSDPVLGVLHVDDPPPLVASLVLGTRVLATQPLEQGVSELTYTLDPLAVIELLVTLRFRVLDSWGTPTDEAEVMLQIGDTMNMSRIPPSGIVEFEGLNPGTCEVMVTLPGHTMVKRTAKLVPGLVDLGDIQLLPAAGLRGTVVDPEGNVLAAEPGDQRGDVRIQFGRRDELTGEFAIDETINLGVNERGEFGLDLEAGVYLIRARGDWFSRNAIVEVPGPPVVLDVFPPSVVVLKLDAGDWDGWRFAIADLDGRPAASGKLRGTAPQRVELPPGSYALRLTDTAGAAREDVPFELRQEELLINLAL